MGLGFKQAGFELAGAWDFDKYAVTSYKQNLSNMVAQADITKMKWDDIPFAEVWTFGFPCQDISIAKKERLGLSGKKSGLFYEVMRLLSETKKIAPEQLPAVILAENVKNLRQDLDVIQEEYEAHGYKFQCRLYDSQNFGVPQHRERYFLLGIRDDIAKTFTLPDEPGIPTGRFKDILEDEVDEKYYIHKKYKLLPNPKGIVIGLADIKGMDSIKRIYSQDKVAPTITTSQGGYRQPKIIDRKGLRKITPREYARLQGFPDDFLQVVSDAQMYKQMGNAVSVPVAKTIAKAIKKWYEENNNSINEVID